ncbi:MAG: hypothetical protein Q8P13_00690 [bacterium]|nr:hypothetical protein [bacterium]
MSTTLKEAVEQGIIKISSNPSGTWWSDGMPKFKSSTDPNLLVLRKVALTDKAGLMLTGEEVTIHLYGAADVLHSLKNSLETRFGEKWQKLLDVELVTDP